jgi:hypothetical protein
VLKAESVKLKARACELQRFEHLKMNWIKAVSRQRTAYSFNQAESKKLKAEN